MHIKIFVCHGFFSYNPGAISLDFPGHEAAKGAELAGRDYKIMRKISKLRDGRDSEVY